MEEIEVLSDNAYNAVQALNGLANNRGGRLTNDEIMTQFNNHEVPRSEWSAVLREVAREHPANNVREARRTDKGVKVFSFPDVNDNNARRIYIVGSATAPIVFSAFNGSKRVKVILPIDYDHESRVDAKELANYKERWNRIWNAQACSPQDADRINQLLNGVPPGTALPVAGYVNQIPNVFEDGGSRMVRPELMYYRFRIFFSDDLQEQRNRSNAKRRHTFAVKAAKKRAVEVKKRNNRKLTSLLTQTVAADAEFVQRQNGLIGYATRGLNRKKSVNKARVKSMAEMARERR